MTIYVSARVTVWFSGKAMDSGIGFEFQSYHLMSLTRVFLCFLILSFIINKMTNFYWGNKGNSDKFYFLGFQNHCR